MARKKRGDIKKFLFNNYKKSWLYIKESRNFIFIIIGLFFLFALIGFFIPTPSYISTALMKFINQLINQTSGLSISQLISFIFFNNLKSSFFGWILGFFLGIFPIFAAIFNGYVLGFVSAMSVKASGVLVLWKLFPHGIFELPAVFISLGMGMKLGLIFFTKKKGIFKENLIEAFRVFVSIVIPLLIIAAIIEGSLIFLMSP